MLQKDTPPTSSSTYNSVHMFEPFENPNFALNFFLLIYFVKTKLSLHVSKVFYEKQLNRMFPKICDFRSWKGSNIQTLYYWKSTPFKTLSEWNNLCRLCKKWSSCLPVRPNKKGIISNHCRPVCSRQDGGEETVLSTTIPVTRTLYITDKNSFKW